MPIQILLADDHMIVRQGLKGLLEREGFKVCGEAADGREAVRLAGACHPDVVVTDLSMPGLNGIDAAREIMNQLPKTKTILLTMYGDDAHILQALSAGVSGYVLKTQAASDLVQAIREVARGSVYLSPSISRAVVDAYRARSSLPSDPLSPRERQILQLLAEGNTTKQIAAILGVSVKTAESHRSRLMAKLDIHQIAGLVRYAIRSGLIQP